VCEIERETTLFVTHFIVLCGVVRPTCISITMAARRTLTSLPEEQSERVFRKLKANPSNKVCVAQYDCN
jgi:hypothetical protein